MLAHLQKSAVCRPRPESCGGTAGARRGPGGEGGNRSAIGPNALLAAALLLSAALVGLATAALLS